MNDHTFCRSLLADALAQARAAQIKVGRLATSRFECGSNLQFQIFETGKGDGPFVTAHCAADAKAKYVLRKIEAGIPASRASGVRG